MTLCDHKYKVDGFCEWESKGKVKRQITFQCIKCDDDKESEIEVLCSENNLS